MRKLILGLLLAALPACALVAVPPAPPVAPDVLTRILNPDVRAFQDYLYAHLQPSAPVILELSPDQLEDGRYGHSLEYVGGGYLIVVDSRLPGTMIQSVLVHEWAHVMLWDSGVYPAEPHGEEWGRMYSKVFQVAVGESPGSP